MKLKFNDPKSIELRDRAIADNLINKLKNKVRCPFCKARVDNCYNYNLEEKYLSWNFKCKEDCPNSLEYGHKYGFEDAETDTDFNGKFLKNEN